MKAVWTAPFREEWKSWDWPCETAFQEMITLRPILADADIWYCHPNAAFVIGHSLLSALPDLRLLVTPSTGLTHIDMDACARAAVPVRSLLNDRGALEEIRASSEFTFLLLLNSFRRLDKLGVDGRWGRDDDSARGHELYGKMIGLIGHGRIGRNIERWCQAFGAGVYWNDPHNGFGSASVYQPSVEWLFRNCDAVVLACNLTHETARMITGDLVRLMKSGARLINTARGDVMLEASVASALADRPDITACVDVVTGEEAGTAEASPLIGLPNVFVTPHVAGTTFESQEKAARIALRLAREWLDAGVLGSENADK